MKERKDIILMRSENQMNGNTSGMNMVGIILREDHNSKIDEKIKFNKEVVVDINDPLITKIINKDLELEDQEDQIDQEADMAEDMVMAPTVHVGIDLTPEPITISEVEGNNRCQINQINNSSFFKCLLGIFLMMQQKRTFTSFSKTASPNKSNFSGEKPI